MPPVTSQLAECLYVGVRNRVRVRVRVRDRFRDGVRDRMLGFGELGRNRAATWRMKITH